MLDHHDIADLVACARAGSMTAAARSLKLTASTLSRHVARLESELGLALLERGRFGVRLTAAGREIVPHAEIALRELEAIRRAGKELGGGERGAVHLGVRFPPLGEPLNPMLRIWRERFPDVALTVTEGTADDLGTALHGRMVDVILTMAANVPEGVERQSLYKEPLVAALPEQHALSGSAPLSLVALSDQLTLVQDETLGGVLAEHTGAASLKSSRLHPASVQSLLALVAAGFGVALVPQSQATVSLPGVAFRPLEPEAAIEMALAWIPEMEDATVGRFVATLRDEARLRR